MSSERKNTLAEKMETVIGKLFGTEYKFNTTLTEAADSYLNFLKQGTQQIQIIGPVLSVFEQQSNIFLPEIRQFVEQVGECEMIISTQDTLDHSDLIDTFRRIGVGIIINDEAHLRHATIVDSKYVWMTNNANSSELQIITASPTIALSMTAQYYRLRGITDVDGDRFDGAL